MIAVLVRTVTVRRRLVQLFLGEVLTDFLSANSSLGACYPISIRLSAVASTCTAAIKSPLHNNVSWSNTYSCTASRPSNLLHTTPRASSNITDGTKEAMAPNIITTLLCSDTWVWDNDQRCVVRFNEDGTGEVSLYQVLRLKKLLSDCR